MLNFRSSIYAFVVLLAVICSIGHTAENKIIFTDDFNRKDGESLGKKWLSKGTIILKDKAALFKPEEGEFRPRMKHAFPAQTAGKVTVSFRMDWLRKSEGTWSFYMQLGNSKKMPKYLVYKEDLAKGIAVNLMWGGGDHVQNENPGTFGYFNEGAFKKLFVANDLKVKSTVAKKSIVTIEVDLDSKTYNLKFNGETYSKLPFDYKGPIDTIRFITNGCSTSGFERSSIDEVIVRSSAKSTDSPVSGIYYAEKMASSPHFKASGIAWWKNRLIISNRLPPKLHTFSSPDKFAAFKELTHPVGVAVDPQGRLLFTEKKDNVLYRLARLSSDGVEETLLKATNLNHKKLPSTGIGSPHFLAVHPNGTIYWSGFPNGGTRYLLPGSNEVTVAKPKIVHTYGIGLSPNHDWLYVNSKIPNKDRRGIWRFPVDSKGRLGEGKFFIAIDQFKTTHIKDLPPAKDGSDSLLGWVGRLQGLAVDRLGYIYVAGAEGHKSGAAVAVFTPDGKKLAAMIVGQPGVNLGIPTNISGLAFGGKDGRTLFITGAGTYRLYRVRLPVAGEVLSRRKVNKDHR